MKKNEILNLQNEVKHLLKIVGWNEKQLARKILNDPTYNPTGDREEQTEYEKIKKRLSRGTTKPENLYEYINFIIKNNPKLDLTKHIDPKTILNEKDRKIIEEIREISKEFFKE